MEFNDAGRIGTSTWFVSLFAAVVGLKFSPGESTIEKLGNVALGFGTANYVAPLIARKLSLGDYELGFVFLLGMFAVSLAAAIWQAIREIKLGSIINDKLGAKKED